MKSFKSKLQPMQNLRKKNHADWGELPSFPCLCLALRKLIFISQVWHVHLPNILDRGGTLLEPDLHIFICKTTSPFLNPTLQINPSSKSGLSLTCKCLERSFRQDVWEINSFSNYVSLKIKMKIIMGSCFILCSKVKNVVQKSFPSSNIFLFAKLCEISTVESKSCWDWRYIRF